MKQKGFSLIELLVVVAIIGILAAVGVVAYNGYTKVAKISATKANFATITEYIESELVKCLMGSYKLSSVILIKKFAIIYLDFILL